MGKTFCQRYCHMADKGLVSVAFRATQMEVTMRHHAFIAATEQNVQERHTVGASAYCHKHFLALVEQFVVAYIFLYSA